ncbi:tumor necrosis factor ligand superfamily member 18 [Tachysurus fulvidraco]|uniref:tumor necrosis factor ligand superfamily member 18 n=1 Tax=Tachysurus fulvidraco TaxID=1234273 RepID=UPI001FEEF5E8|nr:tumor necrosis factor ligand superfamily member 18 [Tachysurus fulvidraco]
MCESGKQCFEGESCVARVDQLKRHIWALMIWVSILSLGLGASIVLHFILNQRSVTEIQSKQTDGKSSTQSQLSTYNLVKNTKDKGRMLWQKKNEAQQDTTIKIEENGNYFLFLKVTLQNRNPGVNYTITVKKMPADSSPTEILVGHINETENSTGFMGIGVLLIENTLINVTCSPQAQLDVINTYIGFIKF